MVKKYAYQCSVSQVWSPSCCLYPQLHSLVPMTHTDHITLHSTAIADSRQQNPEEYLHDCQLIIFVAFWPLRSKEMQCQYYMAYCIEPSHHQPITSNHSFYIWTHETFVVSGVVRRVNKVVITWQFVPLTDYWPFTTIYYHANKLAACGTHSHVITIAYLFHYNYTIYHL